ncbi:hypothetical protein DUNSADRAFT_1671 [Dunaliella salina]|uniref:Encoded protein n=1 Tax=Dunaliella salina TaxID=3046 RepID=A0ABQ7FX75_DUNSA|nr:hypothetical protein DUNSADRAFT_1671 [Dunaliella salina]|eukprot:KAF5826953.1 hypothetical protein DUNSADRAFT_1671 [Dunaliella salina]
MQLEKTTLFFDERHHGSFASQLAKSPGFTNGCLTKVVLQATSPNSTYTRREECWLLLPELQRAFSQSSMSITTLILGDLRFPCRVPPFESLLNIFPNLLHLEFRVNDFSMPNEWRYEKLPLFTQLRSLNITGCPREDPFTQPWKHFSYSDGGMAARQWPSFVSLNSLTIESINCLQLPCLHLLPSLQKLHIEILKLEWDGMETAGVVAGVRVIRSRGQADGTAEKAACVALRELCGGVPSFTCNTIRVREHYLDNAIAEVRPYSTSCSRLLHALSDNCTDPRRLPTFKRLDVSLADFLPSELSRLALYLQPFEEVFIRWCNDDSDLDWYDNCASKCTQKEAVRVFRNANISNIYVGGRVGQNQRYRGWEADAYFTC